VVPASIHRVTLVLQVRTKACFGRHSPASPRPGTRRARLNPIRVERCVWGRLDGHRPWSLSGLFETYSRRRRRVGSAGNGIVGATSRAPLHFGWRRGVTNVVDGREIIVAPKRRCQATRPQVGSYTVASQSGPGYRSCGKPRLYSSRSLALRAKPSRVLAQVHCPCPGRRGWAHTVALLVALVESR